MRRIICMLLAVFLFLPAISCAEIDIKSLSTDELLELKASILQELMDRGEIKSATVPAGKYVVGEDIPEGKYSMSTDQLLVTVVINEYDDMYVISPDNGIGKLTLKAGDTLQVTSTVILTKYTGLTFD